MDTQTSSTGQGAPDEATSRATSNGPERRSFTLAEIIDGFMASYTGADRGIVTRLAFWKSSLGARNAAEVSADDVADTLAELALARGRTFLGRDKRTGERRFKPHGNGPLAAATVNRYLTSLGSAYRWARRRRLLPRGFVSPTRGIERASVSNCRVRYLDEDERACLLAVCRTSARSRLYMLVLMALTTGARHGELLGLRWRDLDLEQRQAYVRTSKNGEPRMLVLVAPLIAAIERIRPRRPDDFVFASDKRPGRAMRTERAFREAVAAAQIENFRFHDLRHCCASYLRASSARRRSKRVKRTAAGPERSPSLSGPPRQVAPQDVGPL
ncbi:MAG TPA: site-specific integrase [Burkholderiales bacterium]|nr:site-specific integrase [Burkholderiales bacterium]